MITQAQLELWLALPVTKALEEAIELEWEATRDGLAQSPHDPSNADLSHALAFAARGGMEMLDAVKDFDRLLFTHGLMEDEDGPKEGV